MYRRKGREEWRKGRKRRCCGESEEEGNGGGRCIGGKGKAREGKRCDGEVEGREGGREEGKMRKRETYGIVGEEKVRQRRERWRR